MIYQNWPLVLDIELLNLCKCEGVVKENILAFELSILEKQSWTEKERKKETRHVLSY